MRVYSIDLTDDVISRFKVGQEDRLYTYNTRFIHKCKVMI